MKEGSLRKKAAQSKLRALISRMRVPFQKWL